MCGYHAGTMGKFGIHGNQSCGAFLFLAGAGLLKFLRVRVSATNSVQSQKLDFELVIVKIRKAGSGSSPKSPAILMLTLLQVP